MICKSIKFTDYDGEERIENHWFNISRAEMVDMQMGETGGLHKKLQQIVADEDQVEIYRFFKDLIAKSYGKKSSDGRRFTKDSEVTKEFMETEAYSELIMQFMRNPESIKDFMKGIMPANIEDEIKKINEANDKIVPIASVVEDA